MNKIINILKEKKSIPLDQFLVLRFMTINLVIT